MRGEEARQQAQAERLTLLKAENKAGYFGVYLDSRKPKPYQARVRRGGKQVRLGSFATSDVRGGGAVRRTLARGAGSGKASGAGGATTERGGEQGRGPAYAVRRFRQGGGRATRRCRQGGGCGFPPMPSDAFVKTETVVKEEEGSGSRPKRQRTK